MMKWERSSWDDPPKPSLALDLRRVYLAREHELAENHSAPRAMRTYVERLDTRDAHAA